MDIEIATGTEVPATHGIFISASSKIAKHRKNIVWPVLQCRPPILLVRNKGMTGGLRDLCELKKSDRVPPCLRTGALNVCKFKNPCVPWTSVQV